MNDLFGAGARLRQTVGEPASLDTLRTRGRRRRHRRRAIGAAAGVVAVALAVTGAIAVTDRPGRQEVVTSPTPVHTAREAASVPGFCPQGLSKMPSQRLPVTFDAVVVYDCTDEVESIAGRGQWNVEIERRATSGLRSLVRALRRPDQEPPPADIYCAADLVLSPLIAVANRAGHLIRPVIPLDECRQPQVQTLRAVERLPWTVVRRRLVQQILTQPEAVSGCESAYKDVFDLEAAQLRPARTGPAIPGSPRRLTVCLFRDSDPPLNVPDGRTLKGSQIEIGDFVGGGTVNGSEEADLLAGIRNGRATTGCPEKHPEFAVVSATADGPSVAVEIGGCDRVLRTELVRDAAGKITSTYQAIGQATPGAEAIIKRVATSHG